MLEHDNDKAAMIYADNSHHMSLLAREASTMRESLSLALNKHGLATHEVVEAWLVCFCVLCVRPRSHVCLCSRQQHEALWCDHSHAPASNTKPFGVIMVYLFHPSLLLRYVNIK